MPATKSNWFPDSLSDILLGIMHCKFASIPLRLLRSGLSSLAAGALLFTPVSGWCGPPFVTDDADVLGYRHHELFVATEQISTSSGKTVTPMLEYSYGVLPDMQLGITVPYVFDRPSGQDRRHGLGDIVLGGKYRFLQETGTRPMLTVAPLVTIANGDAGKGLGNGGAQYFLPVWMQKSWGDWLAYGGGGYWINNAPGADNHWYYGAALQYDISAQVTVGAELFHETDQLPADSSSTGYSLGAIYNLNEHNRVLLSVGRGLTDPNAQNRFSSYLAYALSW